MPARLLRIYLILFVFVLVTGCATSESPIVVETRGKLVLAEEPSQAMGVLEARESLSEQPDAELAIVGVIGNTQETWDAGKAVFIMKDTSLAEHDDGHDHDNCPFCQARGDKAPDGTAIVQFLDESGEVLPIDARELLEINANQTVVVTGVGEVNSLGSLVVSAKKIFVRR